MKKKIFTLLTLLVVCVTGAWADVIYSYTPSTSENTAGTAYTATGGTATLGAAKVDANGFKSDNGMNSTKYINVILSDKTLQAGDIITINAYSTSNGGGIYIAKVNNADGTEGTNYETAGNLSAKNTAEDLTYTVTSSDCLHGLSSIFLFRNGATSTGGVSTYIKQITVSRPTITAPIINTQPKSAIYLVDEDPSALTVAATPSSGELSYQWYKNTDQDKTAKESDKIAGATSATLAAGNISTASEGTTYYYVVVTDDQGSTTSNLATIEVVSGVAPEVSATISAATVRTGTKVTLTANVTAGVPAPTLQWYSCDSDGSNEVPVDGQTSTTYVFTPDVIGTYYYKVKASNASGDAYSAVKTLTVIAQGEKGTVDDLEEITSNYTFIADNHTASGTIGFTAGYLYDDGRIFSPNGNNVATNKGSSTIDGNTYYNSLRVKSSSQDVLAFKVGGTCVITFYTENPLKDPARTIKVGNAVDDNSYGNISDANESHIIVIPAAGIVYLTGTGDRFIAGFKVVFNVSQTITSASWATLSSAYALDFEHATPAGLNAYMVTGTGANNTITLSDAVTNVPGNTGLLLNGASGDYTIPVLASSSTDTKDNKLVACLTETTVKAGTDSNVNYVLVNNGGTAEFQWIDDKDAIVGAGKAYLTLAGGPTPAAPALTIDINGNSTGINTLNVEREMLNGEVYNLAGQRVANPTKGLYIVNGKKVILK